MIRRVRLGIAPIALAIAVAGASLASAGVGGGQPPKISEVEYYEDLEDGKRHNVTASVKGEAVVWARSGKVRSDGLKSRNVSDSERPGHDLYFFRRKAFVKAVLADFAEDGVVKVRVFAANDGGVVRKRCRLVLEPSPMYGDYAGGDCR